MMDQEQGGKGGPSRLSLTVDVLKQDGQSIVTNTFSNTCPRPKAEEPSLLHLGALDLKHGKYKLRITNSHPVAIDGAFRVQVLLSGQSAGFP
jgi:hypothetical protein